MAMAIFDATEDKEWLAQAGLELCDCVEFVLPRKDRGWLNLFFFFVIRYIFVLRSLLLAPAKAQHGMIYKRSIDL